MPLGNGDGDRAESPLRSVFYTFTRNLPSLFYIGSNGVAGS